MVEMEKKMLLEEYALQRVQSHQSVQQEHPGWVAKIVLEEEQKEWMEEMMLSLIHI
jgi:hypothetical protein